MRLLMFAAVGLVLTSPGQVFADCFHGGMSVNCPSGIPDDSRSLYTDANGNAIFALGGRMVSVPVASLSAHGPEVEEANEFATLPAVSAAFNASGLALSSATAANNMQLMGGAVNTAVINQVMASLGASLTNTPGVTANAGAVNATVVAGILTTAANSATTGNTATNNAAAQGATNAGSSTANAGTANGATVNAPNAATNAGQNTSDNTTTNNAKKQQPAVNAKDTSSSAAPATAGDSSSDSTNNMSASMGSEEAIGHSHADTITTNIHGSDVAHSIVPSNG